MDNFVIGTIQENIKTLQSDLNRISSDIPTKFNHLTDVSGKWTIDSSGDIIPEYDNTVSLGSSSKRIKSMYVSDGSIYIVKKNQSNLTTIKFNIDGNDELKITKETYNSVVDLENNNPLSTNPGIVVGSGGAQNINDLDDVNIDVNISSLASNQFLRYDGSKWVNSDITRDDITDFPHITATTDKVAIGNNAGNDSQGQGSTAIGTSAAQIQQGIESVAIGYLAGQLNQEANSIAIGAAAAWKTQGIESVAIGNRAGETDQSNYAVAIGAKSGLTSQGSKTVAIGYTAGETDQGSYAVAIGASAAWKNQGEYTVAIGYTAGYNDQKMEAIAIGYSAGTSFQGEYTVAIGSGAGTSGQGNNAVSLGQAAGEQNQGKYSIAIGSLAGQDSQGEHSIAIGYLASLDNTTHNVDRYIVLNASSAALNPDNNDAFYVKPIRPSANYNKLLYNSDTGEITYQPDVEGVPSLSLDDLTDVTIDSDSLAFGRFLKYTSAIGAGGHGWVSSTITSADIADFYPEVDARIAAGGGVPAPVYSIISPTLPTTLSGSIIIDIDFTKATISGTDVAIDGKTVGTTFGTGVQVSEGGGISTTIDSYVNLNSFAWTENFTIEFYCNMPAYSGTQSGNSLFASFDTVSDVQEADRLSIGRAGTSNGINFTTTNADAIFSSIHVTNASLPGFNGTWGHIVLTHDSSQMPGAQKQLYVNGVRFTDVSDVALSNVPVTYTAGTRNNYWVGRRYNNTDNGVENLKIFRVYNRVLNDTEVATLYESYDITNYQLVSNNATGTETKWVQFPHITTTTDKVAIGYKASQGNTTGYKNYIVLNAQTTELNPDNNDALYVKPIRPSPNTNKLLYNPDTGEITYQPDDEGVPAPVYSIISPTLPTTLLDNNIESFDFTKATISGTYVVIDGNTVGTTFGTGVQVSPTLGIKTTESSYADLNMRDEFAWTSDFTLEFYFMMPAADGTQQNNNYLFTTFDVIAATGDADMGDMLFVSRRHATNGIQFYTAGANFADNNLLYTESTVAGFDGNWGHIVLTHESSQPAASQKQLYVNGVRFTDGVQIQGSIVNFTAGPRDKYRVGRDTSNGDNGVENLKIFRVYNRVLNDTEVATLYESYDITNYQLVSNNATGTETKWVQFPHITTTTDKVAIGLSSGTTSQGNRAVAIGASSGNDNQGDNSIAIGTYAAEINQGSESVALGWHAGRTSQGSSSIAIGVGAAPWNQGGDSVAIGASAGHTSQDQRAIAIGRYAGYSNQGAYSIAIGEQASLQNTGNFKNYIILNAKYEENAATNALNPSHSNAFYVKPIRPHLNNYKLLYNPDSGEITYQEDTADSGNTPDAQWQGQILIAGAQDTTTFRRVWELSNITLAATHIGNATEQPTVAVDGSDEYHDNSVIIRARAPRAVSGKIPQDQYTDNIAIGYNAGAYRIAEVDQNGQLLYGAQGDGSIAIGSLAGESSQGDVSVAIGYSAATWHQGGLSVAIGAYAGNSTAPLPANYPKEGMNVDDTWANHGGVFIGARTGSQYSGYRSVAIGYHAGYWIGDQAVCIGGQGIYDYRKTSRRSVAIGYSASCHEYPHNYDQIAIGHSAIAHGNGSIVIGQSAQNAIDGVQDVDNSIVIGRAARGNGKNTITLGDSSHTLYLPGYHINLPVGDPDVQPEFSFNIKAFNDGSYNNQTHGRLELGFDRPPNGFTPVLNITSTINSVDPVYVYTNFPLYAQVFRTTSDDRIKSNEKPITQGVSVIEQLQPKIYDKHQNHRVPADKEDNDLTGVDYITESGFVAQDVDKIEELKHLVHYNSSHDLYTLSYIGIIPYLVQSIKELNARIKVLESK